MTAKDRSAAEEADNLASKATLVRLANSCARLATRGRTVTPIAHDLDAADYKTISDVLRSLAAMIRDD